MTDHLPKNSNFKPGEKITHMTDNGHSYQGEIIQEDTSKYPKTVYVKWHKGFSSWVNPAEFTSREFAPKDEGPQMEMYEGQMREVINGDRQGWWRFHDHYDRNGYCDNPGRGY